jgi:hypothetical protein
MESWCKVESKRRGWEQLLARVWACTLSEEKRLCTRLIWPEWAGAISKGCEGVVQRSGTGVTRQLI